MFAQYLGLQSNPFEAIDAPEAAFFHKNFQYIYDRLTNVINSDYGIVFVTGEPGIGKTTLTHRIIVDLTKQGKSIYTLDARAIDPELIVQDEPNQETLTTPDATPDHPSLFPKLLNNSIPKKETIFFIDHIECLTIKELNKLISGHLKPIDTQDPGILILVSTVEFYNRIKTAELPPPFNHLVRHCFYFNSIDKEEITAYIDSRLALTGKKSADFFSADVISRFYELTYGIPGAINNLCAASLILSNVNDQQVVARKTVNEAADFCTLPQKNPDNQITEFSLDAIQKISEQKSQTIPSHRENNDDNLTVINKPQQSTKIKLQNNDLTRPWFYPKHAPLLLLMGCLLGIGLSVLFYKFQTPDQMFAFKTSQPYVLNLKTSKEPWSMTISTKKLPDNTRLAITKIGKTKPYNLQASAPVITATEELKIQPENGEIATLLALATQQKENFQLAFPEGNNALETYQKILQLDTTNTLALEGIQYIKMRYLSRASHAELRGDRAKALLNYQNALIANSDDVNIQLKIETMKKTNVQNNYVNRSQ